jgi:hypothetical protein
MRAGGNRSAPKAEGRVGHAGAHRGMGDAAFLHDRHAGPEQRHVISRPDT